MFLCYICGMETEFTLTQQERENFLSCFAKLWGKKSKDFKVVNLMTDSQLCLYWSRWFD